MADDGDVVYVGLSSAMKVVVSIPRLTLILFRQIKQTDMNIAIHS